MIKKNTRRCTSSTPHRRPKGQERYEHLYDSVWLVRSENRRASHTLPHQLNPSGSSSGTAFMLRYLDRSWLLTCHHVVSSALHIWVTLSRQGLSNAQPARLVAACPLLDLALLEFMDPTQAKDVASLLPWTTQSAENALAGPKAGAASLAVGFPLGQTHLKITRGIINGQQNGFLQTDAPINPGNSGGPLMCQRRVVGISAQGAFAASSVGWAIPISYALNFLHHVVERLGDRSGKEMEDNDGLDNVGDVHIDPVHVVHFPRTWGMEYFHRSDFLLLPEAARSSCGVRVHRVYPFGFAAEARLQPNDVLLKLAGHVIDGAGNLDLYWLQESVSLQIFLYHQNLGNVLEMEVLRNNKRMTLHATLDVEHPRIAYSLSLWPVHHPTPHLYLAGLVFMNLTPQLLVMLQSSIAMDIPDFELNGGGSFESPMQESSVSILDPALLRPMQPQHWSTSFVVITHLLAGSLMQQHTIFKVGDILKTCNRQPIRTVDQLRDVLRTQQEQPHGDTEDPLLHLVMESGREAWLHMHTVRAEEQKLKGLHGYLPLSSLVVNEEEDNVAKKTKDSVEDGEDEMREEVEEFPHKFTDNMMKAVNEDEEEEMPQRSKRTSYNNLHTLFCHPPSHSIATRCSSRLWQHPPTWTCILPFWLM